MGFQQPAINNLQAGCCFFIKNQFSKLVDSGGSGLFYCNFAHEKNLLFDKTQKKKPATVHCC
jgi:hypothetical protein